MRFFSYFLAFTLLTSAATSYGQVVYNNASTAGESYARGMADMVRSAGSANLLNSEAAINYEAARAANFENRLLYTNSYFENKRMNKEYRAAARRPPATQEQLFRYSQERMPKRLAPSELDPFTGSIAWPLLLEQDEYAEARRRLEESFVTRVESQGADLDAYMKIRKTVDQTLAYMKSKIKDYPPDVYMVAKRFLVSLKNEARMPVQ